MAAHEGVDVHRRDTPGPQVRHLVLHERNEGRNDQGVTRQQQGRHLEADGLAAACRQNGQNFPPRQDGADDLLLAGPERPVPEPALQDAGRGLLLFFRYIVQPKSPFRKQKKGEKAGAFSPNIFF